MIHFGDITKISGYDAPVVDVITGGSPCQDLSVAGKRAGLAGERSGLFMEQMRIVKEMRERDVRDNGRTGFLVRPRYMVWENVPGAFSSGNPKGSDFQAVLEEIVRVVCKEAPPVPIPKEGWPKAGCISGVGDSGCTFSIAWRVHDAQYWGVPQRRKRIALVCDFGGLSAPEILFERKGLSGDSEPCGAAREGTPRAIGNRVGKASAFTYRGRENGCNVEMQDELAYSLRNPSGGGSQPNVLITAGTTGGGVESASGAISFQERAGKPGGGKGLLIQHEHIGALRSANNQGVLQSAEPTYCLQGNVIDRDVKQGGAGVSEDISFTLNCIDRHGVMAFKQGQGAKAGGIGAQEECSPTLSAVASGTNRVPAVLQSAEPIPINTMVGTRDTAETRTTFGIGEPGDPQFTISAAHAHAVYDARGNGDGNVAPTMTGDHQNRVTDYTALCVGNGQLNQMSMAEQANTLDTMHDQQAVMTASIVRRLTPHECERLQGFPDGWTLIGEPEEVEVKDYAYDIEDVEGEHKVVKRVIGTHKETQYFYTDEKGQRKRCADSARYKALGNSIALPFWQWLARRICAQYERNITMASLFDGIGGFPLVFERCGAKAVWASEIEEFPIAVTKKHFPEEET